MNRRRADCAGALAALVLVLSACTPPASARAGRREEPRMEAPAEVRHEEELPPREVAPEPQLELVEPLQAPTPPRANAANPAAGSAASEAPTAAIPELFRIERGTGEVPLLFSRDETLVYEVHLDLGWLGNPAVGKVTMSSSVQPFLSVAKGAAPSEQVVIKGRAEGSYQVYTLDNLISSSLLPQEWPRAVHRNIQTGTENRQRETLIGRVDGVETSRYRGDGHCKGCKDKGHFVEGTFPWSDDEHCKKCKRGEHRVWREAKTREVPPGTLDMLTAVTLARSMVLDGRDLVEFDLIDRMDLWRVQLQRGNTKVVETSAGKFTVVGVKLKTGPHESSKETAGKFEGLFGIHGSISIWMEARSGVPVLIQGTVPAGPVDLDVSIELRSARGAPKAFGTTK